MVSPQTVITINGITADDNKHLLKQGQLKDKIALTKQQVQPRQNVSLLTKLNLYNLPPKRQHQLCFIMSPHFSRNLKTEQSQEPHKIVLSLGEIRPVLFDVVEVQLG
jgi:hypothetical protein